MATVDTVGVKYEADLKALVSAQDKLIAENKAIAAGADKIGKEYTENTQQAAKGVDKLTKKTGELKKESEGLGGTMKKVGTALVAAFAVERLIAFGKAVIDITAKFQRYEAVLTNTLGSGSEAQKALTMIQSFAASTPFSVDELTASFVKLANQGFIPTSSEMRKLGDLAASTGKTFDMLAEAIIDAQTGEFERLKEFGIRASKEGDQVKFTFKGVETQTDFTAEAIQRYILSLGDLAGVSGGMAAISETLGGKISNLGDAWDNFMLTLGDGAFSDFIGDGINKFTIFLNTVSDGLAWLGDRQAFELKEQEKVFATYFAAIEEKAKTYTANMTSIEVEGQVKRLQMQIAIRHAAFIEAQTAGDKEGMQLAANMLKRYNGELKLLQEIQAKKEGSEKKAEEKRDEEWEKGADKRAKQAEQLQQKLLKQEFDTQALRIAAMTDGLGKDLALRNLAFEKEKNQHRDNKAALLLIEEQYYKDLRKIVDSYEIKRIDATKGVVEKVKTEREKEIEEQNKLVQQGFEKWNAVQDAKKERERMDAEDRLIVEQNAFTAISSLGEIFIQDQQKLAAFQKAIALFQIGIDTARAISAGIAASAGVPFPANLIAITTTIATVLANVAQAKQLLSASAAPAYKDGVIDLQGPGTGTSDSIHARLSKGESVMTNRETAAYKDELMAIRKGQFEDMILSKYVLPALREDRKQKDMGSNLAKSLMLQSAFDDSGIIRAVEKNAPATAKDIKKQTRDLTRVFKDAAYIQTKKWRPNG